ncbi:unnamed protein product [Ceutorhynchus assimilis]|uniref:Mutator-like transposase domain-containing protein n=1 Tax=Ceutorhynchus assimilis TaxID=467358 RepID=A0A9N9QNM0_9CUCU|nr:unnamed protein product [Ceutorhynchus assimilis]
MFSCTLENLVFANEVQEGLLSKFLVKCNMCNYSAEISSADPKDHKMNLNKCLVNVVTSIGCGFAHLQDILNNLQLPVLSQRKYADIQSKLFYGIEESAIQEMRKAADEEKAIALSEKNVGVDGVPEILVVKDILNIPSHTFGEHQNCKSLRYFCEKDSPCQDNLVPQLKEVALYQKLQTIFDHLSKFSNSLIHDVDSNLVEQFNSVISKYIGGKRVNYTQKRQYKSRSYLAALTYNTKLSSYYSLHKFNYGSSPSLILNKKYEKRRQLLHYRQKPKKKLFKEKDHKEATNTDKNYGPNCEKPDMTLEEYQERKEEFLKNIKKTKTEIENIEERTREQANSTECQCIIKNPGVKIVGINEINCTNCINEEDLTGLTTADIVKLCFKNSGLLNNIVFQLQENNDLLREKIHLLEEKLEKFEEKLAKPKMLEEVRFISAASAPAGTCPKSQTSTKSSNVKVIISDVNTKEISNIKAPVPCVVTSGTAIMVADAKNDAAEPDIEYRRKANITTNNKRQNGNPRNNVYTGIGNQNKKNEKRNQITLAQFFEAILSQKYGFGS